MEIGAQNGACVDTVRALHQTIISLRAALEQSRSEVDELKARYGPTGSKIFDENNILRRKLKSDFVDDNVEGRGFKPKLKKHKREAVTSKYLKKHHKEVNSDCDSDTNLYVSTETICCSKKVSKSLENLSLVKSPTKRNLTKSKTVTFSNISDGDKQISTVNSLFPRQNVTTTRKSKKQKLNSVQDKGQKRESEQKIRKVKNLKFAEEIVKDKNELCLSGFSQEEELKLSSKNLSEFNTCVEKSKELLFKEIKPVVKDKSNGESKIKQNKNRVTKHRQSKSNKKTIDPIDTEEKEQQQSFTNTVQEESNSKHENEGNLTSENSLAANTDTNDSSDSPEKSSELGKILETVLFHKEEKLPLAADTNTNTSKEAQDTQESNIEEPLVDANKEEEANKEQKIEETKSENNNKEEIKTEAKEVDDTDTSGTLCSSDSSRVNNVEISVKIFKGSNKKPIEIDVQTKTSKKKGKKKQKQTESEMNDKSQNTSFDNDGVFPDQQQQQQQQASNIVQNLIQNDTEQEVDDIELIFTTDDTKDADFKEELVSIEPYASSTQLLQCPQTDYDDKADVSDRELEDDVFNDGFDPESQETCGFQSQTFDFRREQSQIYNSKSDNSINHEDKSLKSYYSYQDSSFENKSLEKDESFDRFDEKVRIIETDISKIGIQDVDYNMGRRNTCPNPLQYRPIMHREALGRGLNSRKSRPILAHSNVVRKECGAQTDISAIPGSAWRSESSLAHKVKIGDNFTTLPSKFPHPASKLKLSEKTVEARRVLLSDIGFTSMVPELSRSADHLCPSNIKTPSTTTYGQFLRTTDLYSPGYASQKFTWTATATPSEGSHSQSGYSSQYPLSSPPAPMRRCSAPVSPSRRAAMLKSTPSRVRFANGSLPELRGDWTTTIDSGESTDSLVEEAEHFLRRSIDCLAPTRDIYYRSEQSGKGTVRRASAPEPSRDNVPPPGWQPFLPRVSRDLHLDYWVKVISQEGRVKGGRVRYVGPLMSQTDQFVGVQLSTPDGHSDGTFNNRRYFNCEPYHGIFVPFKKIIMGWRP